MVDTLKTFRYPGAYKPFGVLIFVFLFQQFSGSYAIIFYAVSLFKVTSSSVHIPSLVRTSESPPTRTCLQSSLG